MKNVFKERFFNNRGLVSFFSKITWMCIFVLFLSPRLTEARLPEGKVSLFAVKGAVTVDAVQAKQLFEKQVLFIDVRKNSDWDAGRIPGAVHLEQKVFFTSKNLSKIAQTRDSMVIYCNGVKCERSSKCAALAVRWGYEKVYYFRLGFPQWKKLNYPVE